jgi:hypothetical protein
MTLVSALGYISVMSRHIGRIDYTYNTGNFLHVKRNIVMWRPLAPSRPVEKQYFPMSGNIKEKLILTKYKQVLNFSATLDSARIGA